jgi:hypothetical protein
VAEVAGLTTVQQDIDLIIDRVARERPGTRVRQLEVVHPGADDDGLWYFSPGTIGTVHVESSTWNCPFIIEADYDDGSPHEARTVDEVVAIVLRLLDRPGTGIWPNSGAGSVTFKMSKDDVRAVLGTPDREFLRSQFTTCVEWDYEARGINVVFDTDHKCVGICLIPPSDPVLKGRHLLHMGASAAMTLLRGFDPDAVLDDGGFTSKKLGVSIYAPDADDEPDEPAYSVLVFRADYFDVC